MAVFPLFVDLKGKRCIVVGGGEIAARKVDILLQFEADLIIVAPEVNNFIKELEDQGKINIIRKEYFEQVIDNAFLIIAATSSPEVNESIFRDAEKRNIPVNIVDDPEKCTFIFPSIVKRGDLTIGISTSGTYPALSKKIRKIVEEVFTEDYSEILKLLSDFRIKVRKSSLKQEQREKILKQVIEEFYHKGDISYQVLRNILAKYEIELGLEVVLTNG
jgi:precorrin-2 dehydrogenase / sirohydrochlorin ferrochelatase